MPILGDVVCAGLELLSSVTLRKGNGLVERWLMCRHAAAPPGRAREPLLPPSIRFCGGTAAHIDAPLLQELQKAGASEASAEHARAAMAAEAEAAFLWLRRQRDDARQSTEVRVRTADTPGGAAVAAARAVVAATGGAATGGGVAATMLEVRCGKDIKLQLSAPHRDKLHELYCRAAARRVGVDDPAFLRAPHSNTDPDPGPNPGPNPGPDPDPGPNPGPDPGPSPQPQPCPQLEP